MPTPIPECRIREESDGGYTLIIPGGERCYMPADGNIISVSGIYTDELTEADFWDWSQIEERGFMPRYSIRDAAGGWLYLIVGGGAILLVAVLCILRSLIE